MIILSVLDNIDGNVPPDSPIEDMRNFACPKNQYELFLKKLNGERLVDLKDKLPANKEIMKMLVY